MIYEPPQGGLSPISPRRFLLELLVEGIALVSEAQQQLTSVATEIRRLVKPFP